MDSIGNWTDDHPISISESGIINHTSLADNETLLGITCEQRQVEFGSPLPLSINTANVLRYMQVTYYIICFPFGVFLNLFVLLLILRFKRLQNITFILAFQVSASDLVNAILVFPTSAANAIADRYVFTGLCTTIGIVVFHLRIARIYLMFVLALDRFLTVFMPFWYQRCRMKVVVLLSLGAWMLSFIVALIPVKGLLECYSFTRYTWACVPLNGCLNKRACSVYNSTSIALSNGCNVVSLLLYFMMFCKARQLRNKTRTLQQSSAKCEAGMKDAATQALSRERRANVTFFLLFLALTGVSILPFLFFVVGRPVITTLDVVPPPAYIIMSIIGRAMYPLLTVVDPIVIMRNQDFRAVIGKLFRKQKQVGVGERPSMSSSTDAVKTSNTAG